MVDPMAPPSLPSQSMKKLNWKRVLRVNHGLYDGTMWEEVRLALA